MNVIFTPFKDLVILEPKVHGDERGYFMESYSYDTLKKNGIDIKFVQDNQSKSKYGVLRGLHYQNYPYQQTKLIRVLSGTILDVVVDLRKEEKTFGQHFSIELSSENKKQLLVPRGFAHGLVVLSESAEVLYKCDEFYHPEAEGGIYFDDPKLNIDWKVAKENLILSEKDKKNALLENAVFKF
jgi:dTDP-4-dehydrorhamnose 3,5-epimerase